MPHLQAYENYLIANDKAPQTVRGYLSDLRQFTRWFEQSTGEAFEPQAITPSDVRAYRDYLFVVKRRKANTINRQLMSLRSYMAFAVRQGMLEQNPVEAIKAVQQVSQAPRWLDKKEQYALQRAIEKDLQIAQLRYPVRVYTRKRDAAMVTLILHTGLRLSELLALRLADIELSERKGQLQVLGKGRKQRTIPLNAEARKAVQSWLQVRPEVAANDMVFLALEQTSEGSMSSRSVQSAVRRLGQDAGLPELSPHALRHTFAKNLVDAGVSLEKVAALLGHSSLNTTRVYITPGQQDLERAVDQIG
ncbi:MAG: tyrosine-type recombinase/integrase [Anaerolineae bacterium]|nr:tyrosine-type recombinase/integrase [Anaerolineae bacterium]